MLVDTCVWIDFFNGAQTGATVVLSETLHGSPELVHICDIVYMEILLGFPLRERRRFDVVREFLDKFESLELRNRLQPAQTIRRLRDLGVTLKGFQSGLLDAIIAQTALDHEQEILTVNRRDFEKIQRVTDLKVLEV
jgi:hypothetical protein